MTGASSPLRQQGAPPVQGGHSRGASGGDHGGLYRRGAGRPGRGGRTARTCARTAIRARTPWYAGSFTGQRATGSRSRRRSFRRLRVLTSFVRFPRRVVSHFEGGAFLRNDGSASGPERSQARA